MRKSKCQNEKKIEKNIDELKVYWGGFDRLENVEKIIRNNLDIK